MIKPGLYTYKYHLQCIEIRKHKGKLYMEYLCSATGVFCSYEFTKEDEYWFLADYIGKV